MKVILFSAVFKKTKNKVWKNIKRKPMMTTKKKVCKVNSIINQQKVSSVVGISKKEWNKLDLKFENKNRF